FELSFPIAQAEWRRVHSIFRRFCAAEIGGDVEQSLAECQRFVDEYVMPSLTSGEVLFEGRLLASHGLLAKAGRKRVEQDRFERCIDELLLCCSVLRGYLKSTLGSMRPDSEMHLRRNDEGQVDYSRQAEKSQGWNPLQLDAGYAGFFCCDPRARREKL